MTKAELMARADKSGISEKPIYGGLTSTTCSMRNVKSAIQNIHHCDLDCWQQAHFVKGPDTCALYKFVHATVLSDACMLYDEQAQKTASQLLDSR